MRTGIAVALICSAALGASIAGSAGPQHYAFCTYGSNLVSSCGWVPRIGLRLDAAVTPKTLPARAMAPVGITMRGKVATRDGTHPPALREAVIDFDEHGTIDAAGLPTCGRRQLRGRVTGSARHVCRQAIVGRGLAHVGLAGAAGSPVTVPLTVFNGGVEDGVTKAFVHGTIGTAEPLPVVAAVKVRRVQKGRYGLESISRIPRLLGGAGSVLDFHLKIQRRFEYQGARRSYLQARCFDGRLNAKLLKAELVDEAGGPRTKTTLAATVIRACSQQSGPAGR